MFRLYKTIIVFVIATITACVPKSAPAPSPAVTIVPQRPLWRLPRWDGPIEEVHPGDEVWFTPGEKPWHGATVTTAMSHIAIHEHLMVKWLSGWNMSATNSTWRSKIITSKFLNTYRSKHRQL